MNIIMSKNDEAINAYKLVTHLQELFVNQLNNLSYTIGSKNNFEKVFWVRDEGIHGGGSRYEARDRTLFNTASVNVSQVHYDDDKSKQLQSASAISTIIHPKNPNVPSIHIHISLTQIKGKDAYWRVMADLNPSIENSEDTNIFNQALKDLSKQTYEEGINQGDKYFNIPALNRHRGISHFYLENYKTQDKENDYSFAKNFGEGIINTYINIIDNAFKTRIKITKEEIQKQLDYHTLYLFQVLTLDRGTTSGLLIHNQNDVGIMGSLPTFINKQLLSSWKENVEQPQNELVVELAKVIDEKGTIDISTKEKLANVVRKHYKQYPEALSMQASGNTIPSTVTNHQKK